MAKSPTTTEIMRASEIKKINRKMWFLLNPKDNKSNVLNTFNPPFYNDWNYLMDVVEKIEDLIEGSIEIEYSICISWHYSPKKTGTFSKGAGGGGGWTEKRTPFEPIFGKFYQIHCYYSSELKFKPKKGELAKNKREDVFISCSRWIDWYNKTVLKQK